MKAESLMSFELDLESSLSESLILVAVRCSNKPICLEVEDTLLQDLLRKTDSYVTLVSGLPGRKGKEQVKIKATDL